jgi:hypothetical protein
MDNKNKSTFGSDKSDKKEGFAHKAGDKIERVGEKISNAGATNVGRAVYNAGNKIEHSQDGKGKK